MFSINCLESRGTRDKLSNWKYIWQTLQIKDKTLHTFGFLIIVASLLLEAFRKEANPQPLPQILIDLLIFQWSLESFRTDNYLGGGPGPPVGSSHSSRRPPRRETAAAEARARRPTWWRVHLRVESRWGVNYRGKSIDQNNLLFPNHLL